jgi:hypothetical protein
MDGISPRYIQDKISNHRQQRGAAGRQRRQSRPEVDPGRKYHRSGFVPV